MPDINDTQRSTPTDEPAARPVKTLNDRVADILRSNMRGVASLLNPDPRMAARMLIDLLEPARHEEAPRTVSAGANRERIVDPYADRVLDCARRFVRMPVGEQETVLTGMRDGVPWRGDDIDFYVRVIGETVRMREMGADAYRKQALRAARTLLGGAR